MDINMQMLADAVDKAAQASSNSPVSMGITKDENIQSKTVKEQTFLEFLEQKNRTRDVNTTNVSFYEEDGGSTAEFITELGDIPTHTAKTFTEVTDSTKTIAYPVQVSMKAQEGIDVIDLRTNLITDGYVKVNNLVDKTLLQGNATQSNYEFNRITKDVTEIDNEQEPITEQVVKDALQACHDAGGSPDCIVTDAFVANQLDDLVSPYIRYNNVMEMALGHKVSTFRSIDGTFIPILVDNNVPKTAASGQNLERHNLIVLDSSTVDVAYQRRPSLIQLAQTNLATNEAIYSWVTAYNTAKWKSRVIKNISPESA